MSDPIDLKALAGNRYRITLDESAAGEPLADRPWSYRIPCKYGFISVHGPGTLAAWTGSRLKIASLAEAPGARVHQRGDREIRVLFTPDRLDEIARLLGARRRRPRLSEEHRAKLAAGSEPFRFRRFPGEAPAAKDAVGAGT
jgi:hypothetical protein